MKRAIGALSIDKAPMPSPILNGSFGPLDYGPAPRKAAGLPVTATQHIDRSRAVQHMSELLVKLKQIQAASAPRHRRTKKIVTMPGSVRPAVSKLVKDGGGSNLPKPREPVVIFDWDDTILPTWFIAEVVGATRPKEDKYAALPEHSPYFYKLKQHACLVEEILRAACEHATVSIVTLAARPWVDDSARLFLPGLDLISLLGELGIKVFYAREHVSPYEKRGACVEEGVDLYTIAKRNAMRRFLKPMRKVQKRLNVLCIGDSCAEEVAVKEILWSDDSGYSLCKTVKLLDDPTLEVISMELTLLVSFMGKMVSQTTDFHMSFNDSGAGLDLEGMVH